MDADGVEVLKYATLKDLSQECLVAVPVPGTLGCRRADDDCLRADRLDGLTCRDSHGRVVLEQLLAPRVLPACWRAHVAYVHEAGAAASFGSGGCCRWLGATRRSPEVQRLRRAVVNVRNKSYVGPAFTAARTLSNARKKSYMGAAFTF